MGSRAAKFAVPLVVSLAAVPAWAGVVSASASSGTFNNNTSVSSVPAATGQSTAEWFFETTVTLASSVATDHDGSSTTSAITVNTNGTANNNTTGTVASGSRVSSYLVNFKASNGSVTGQITFDRQIVGVMFLSTNLNQTTVFNKPGVNYVGTGLGTLDNGDTFTITNPTTGQWQITFTIGAQGNGSDVDDIRILEDATVPEPSTWALFALGAAGLAALGRRARRPGRRRA